MRAWWHRLGAWYWRWRSKRTLRRIDRLLRAKLTDHEIWPGVEVEIEVVYKEDPK